MKRNKLKTKVGKLLYDKNGRRIVKCKRCGRLKANHGFGFCWSCYCNDLYKRSGKFREGIKRREREHFQRRCRKDKDWNAERQREYRKKCPIKFNTYMVRYYSKRLPLKERKKLFDELAREPYNSNQIVEVK